MMETVAGESPFEREQPTFAEAAAPLRILHVVVAGHYLENRANGLSVCVWELTSAQRQSGHRSVILAAADATRLQPTRSFYPGSSVHLAGIVGPRAIGYSPAAEQWARSRHGGGFDVLHQHGIWPAFTRVTTAWRRQHRRPSVVAPHGSLEPHALGYSRSKKRLALAAWERTNLEAATCLHATSADEVRSFRDQRLRNPVAVIGNGVPGSWLRQAGDGARFRAEHGVPSDGRIILFLSRIHPKKGLLLLVEAMGRAREALRPWRLVVAGPVEAPQYAEAVKRRASELGLADRIHFTGTLLDQQKRDAFAAAELFALATLSDNFAIAVAEALGAGVPVITTREAHPWHVLETERCGWWVPADERTLAAALETAAQLPRNELKAMGQRGTALVERSYLWDDVAHQTIALYQWLLGHAARPDFVVLN
jgi:glycosyltransferase involved in cell wall biosynthesis